MNVANKIVYGFSNEKNRKIRKMYCKLLQIIFGLDLGIDVKIGSNVQFRHGGLGTVIHPDTVIEDNVIIYSNVTVGKALPWIEASPDNWGGVILGKGCILGTGARVLGKAEPLIVGSNTIIGANSVLTCSTGVNEVWAGIPATKLRDRDKDEQSEKHI